MISEYKMHNHKIHISKYCSSKILCLDYNIYVRYLVLPLVTRWDISSNNIYEIMSRQAYLISNECCPFFVYLRFNIYIKLTLYYTKVHINKTNYTMLSGCFLLHAIITRFAMSLHSCTKQIKIDLLSICLQFAM